MLTTLLLKLVLLFGTDPCRTVGPVEVFVDYVNTDTSLARVIPYAQPVRAIDVPLAKLPAGVHEGQIVRLLCSKGAR